jgi:hypothetical protein
VLAPDAPSDRINAFRRLPREFIWLELLQRVASGDEKALASLCHETVYNQVWRIARNFDAARGTVTAWLVTMTQNSRAR